MLVGSAHGNVVRALTHEVDHLGEHQDLQSLLVGLHLRPCHRKRSARWRYLVVVDTYLATGGNVLSHKVAGTNQATGEAFVVAVQHLRTERRSAKTLLKAGEARKRVLASMNDLGARWKVCGYQIVDGCLPISGRFPQSRLHIAIDGTDRRDPFHFVHGVELGSEPINVDSGLRKKKIDGLN